MTLELKERSFDEMIKYFNNKVADMDISPSYKTELLGMITAIGFKYEKDVKEPKTNNWIPCERELPECGQKVLASTKSTCFTQVFKGTSGASNKSWWWEKNSIKRIEAWMPLPKPYQEEGEK